MTVMGRWHGTDAELDELRNAVNRNCGCEHQPGPRLTSVRTTTCLAHAMLESADQSLLDHLVYGRWLRARLLVEEWDTACLTRPSA